MLEHNIENEDNIENGDWFLYSTPKIESMKEVDKRFN